MKTKREEMDDPNSCWNKAKDDEPVFILLGRDISAPYAIEMWVDARIVADKNKFEDKQIQESLEVAKEMTLYERKLHGK
jgi:hypothetical protein